MCFTRSLKVRFSLSVNVKEFDKFTVFLTNSTYFVKWKGIWQIFLSCDVVKGVGYYHGIFMEHLYLNYWNVFSWNQKHKMQWNALRYQDIRLWCDVTDVNNTVSIGSMITVNKELLGVMRVTSAKVTLEVVGGTTQSKGTESGHVCAAHCALMLSGNSYFFGGGGYIDQLLLFICKLLTNFQYK